MDDILDYAGDAATTGKNLGADLEEGKVTLPLIYAMQRASDSDRALIEEAIRKGHGDFDRISAIVRDTGALEAARETTREEAARGIEALKAIPAPLNATSDAASRVRKGEKDCSRN